MFSNISYWSVSLNEKSSRLAGLSSETWPPCGVCGSTEDKTLYLQTTTIRSETPSRWELTWFKIASLTVESLKLREQLDLISTLMIHLVVITEENDILFHYFSTDKNSVTTVRIISSLLLTIVAEEGIWRCTASVPQGVSIGQVQHTVSIIIRLSRMPISERAVALVGPFPVISEQTDPKSGRRCLVSIKHFLDSLIFRLVPHTGQVSAALPAEILGSSPRHVCTNDRHRTGTVVFKYGKMERVRCVQLF